MIRKIVVGLLCAAVGVGLVLGCGGSSVGSLAITDKQQEKEKPGKK